MFKLYGVQECIATIDRLPYLMERRMYIAVAKVAVAFKKMWIEGITTGSLGLEVNAPATLAAKKGIVPLVDSKALIAQIKAYNMGKFWFVGVKEGKVSRKGLNFVSLLELLEYGLQHDIKPKGHKYLSIPVTRKSARHGSPLDFPEKLKMIEGTKGAVFKDPKGVVQYALVRIIRKEMFPPRPSLRKSFIAFWPVAIKIFEVEMAKAIIHA